MSCYSSACAASAPLCSHPAFDHDAGQRRYLARHAHLPRRYPSVETAQKLYDQLDLQRGVDAFQERSARRFDLRGAQRVRDAGVKDNEACLIFSGLMDSKSLFLTANADTVYFLSDHRPDERSDGGRDAARTLGTFDDMWFHWIIDFGAPGPDRGAAASISCCRPATTARCPKAATSWRSTHQPRSLMLGRAFLVDNDPKPAVDDDQDARSRSIPTRRAAYGTSIAHHPRRQGSAGAPSRSPGHRHSSRAAGKSFNTIPPSDFGFLRDAQRERAGASRPRRSTRRSADSSPPSASSRASRSRPTHG